MTNKRLLEAHPVHPAAQCMQLPRHRDFVARLHAEPATTGSCLASPPADAPFCKHIFVRNWTGAPVSALPITDGNRHLLQSGGHAGLLCTACGVELQRPSQPLDC